ncbi:MAG: hypothetical protein MJ065_09905, partial [Oscillospiraceae bacterium]|nr:hypothetical protein [Oscillospiraceae bacterium]
MHVDLISTTKGSPKVVHATENSKKTACGINLTKPESIGQFASAGELSDVIQITCEKCKTIIAKKLIKESNREMAAQLKEEQKRLKRERSASRHQHGGAAEVSPAPQDNAKSATSGGYIPPSMRKTIREQQNQAPIETPTPAVDPTPMPRTSPAAAAHDDALSQFAIPTVPTSVPGAIPIAPPSAPAPAPTPTPASAEADDVLAQFAIPTVPTSVPGAIPIAAPAPAPAPTPAPAEADDVFAQFAIPTVPTSVPGAIPIAAPAPAPAPTPAPAVDDDVLAQFAIPTVPTSAPG